MSIADRYQQASFRGVPFFIRSESENRGPKVVRHEYPDSDFRFVENLGKSPPVYSFSAFVHGDDVVEQSLKLMKALDQSGIGILVHPIYGRQEVKSEPYTRSSSENAFGEIEFSLTFSTSKENISLTIAAPTSANVSNLASTTRALAGAAMKATLIINKAKRALETSQRVAQQVMKIVNGEVKSLADLDPVALSVFDRALGTSLIDVYKTAITAEDFANTMTNFYDSVIAVNPPAKMLGLWSNLLDYETDRIPGETDTAIRIAEEQNTLVLNNHTRVNALINYYEAIAFSSFNTDEEILNINESIANSFDSIFGDNTNPLAGDYDLRQSVLEMKTALGDVLDLASENVFKIITINPGETTLALLSYRLYGSLDNLDILTQLNPTINPSNIRYFDSVKVLKL